MDRTYGANNICQIASRRLPGAFAHHASHLGNVKADRGHAVQDAADSWHGAMLADNVLEQKVVAEGTMGVDGGLEGHDWLVGGHGICDLGGDFEEAPQGVMLGAVVAALGETDTEGGLEAQ